jgi:hypothetical protein
MSALRNAPMIEAEFTESATQSNSGEILYSAKGIYLTIAICGGFSQPITAAIQLFSSAQFLWPKADSTDH